MHLPFVSFALGLQDEATEILSNFFLDECCWEAFLGVLGVIVFKAAKLLGLQEYMNDSTSLVKTAAMLERVCPPPELRRLLLEVLGLQPPIMGSPSLLAPATFTDLVDSSAARPPFKNLRFETVAVDFTKEL